MFKKLLIASAILAACSTSVLASGEWGPGTPYVGAGVGIRATTATANSARDINGRILLGYGGMVVPCFYLAGEVFGGDSASIYNKPAFYVGSVRQNGFAGISVLPGYMLNDKTMLFVRAGAVWGNFTSTRFSNSRFAPGAQGGVGLQTNLAAFGSGWSNWDVRGEYDYNWYGKVRSRGSNVQADEFNASLIYKIM